ncbi:MAG: bile acid:sodium symporter family protein [Eudoraea sp.]|nr:bile acid:sodium symporter family protein [Eudoraea sp.]
MRLSPNLFLYLTLLIGFGTCVYGLIKTFADVGPPLIAFFLFLALTLRLYPKFKGFSFTVLIFAAVTASMYYPVFFTQVGTFELKGLIVPLLMIIMFGMGTAMSLADFKGVARMPKGVLVGLMVQFSVMPLLGFGLAYLANLPPEIAAGVILVGCSPSGLASNVMAYISGSNLALSVSLTAVATLLSPLLTPLWMKLLADQLVPIDFFAMLWSITKIVILPIIAGLLFHHFAHGRFPWLDKAMPIVSMAGIAIIITIITAAGRDDLLTLGLTLIAVVIIHNLMGYLFGYYGSRLIGLKQQDARAVAFEVGMQNAGLASGIAVELGKLATMGLAPAVFGPWMNISGSSLATFWRDRKPSSKI